MIRIMAILVIIGCFGCATGVGGGEVVLRKYDVPITIDGDNN